jgi:hypothetical protein
MIPPIFDPETASDGEKYVYERLAADEAHPDWVVLHSQDIPLHQRQMEGEADFIVVAPGLGVLVLEVKGCHELDIRDGLWFYGSDTQGKPRSPFRQASEAMHSVRDAVWRQRTPLKNVLFWSAVCFPYISFDRQPDGWAPWQIIDQSHLGGATLGECIEAVLEQARGRAAELGKPWFFEAEAAGEPTLEQRDEIVRILRPDREVCGSPQARARCIDADIRQFTEQQFGALEKMQSNRRVVFDGPAGTGKTVLAIEAARRGHAAGRRVLLMCFNRPLAEWLREQAAGVAETTTISDYMVRVARIPSGSPLFDEDDFWEVTLPQRACDALLDVPGEYDELVIDEAQDVLRDQFFDVLDLSLKGGMRKGRWRLFGDFAHQAIYDDSVDLDAFCEREDEACTVYPLDENCRNSPAIAALACAGGGIASAYAKVLRTDDDDGSDPQVRYYATAQEQSALLRDSLEELAEAGFRGPSVAILSPRGDAHCIASTLSDQPWCDRVVPLVHEGPNGPVPDLRSNKTRYASIHRFKGLEARAVVLTDFEKLEKARDRDLFYIGATRATQRLVVLANERLRGRF